MYFCSSNYRIKGTKGFFLKAVVYRLKYGMDPDQNFCLQFLKDALENCDDKEVDVDDGKKKESEEVSEEVGKKVGEEVSRLTKAKVTVEKSHNDKKEKGKKRKKKSKSVKFDPTSSETSYFRGDESQTRILNLRVKITQYVFVKIYTLIIFFYLGS